jgi:hypothetical protein
MLPSVMVLIHLDSLGFGNGLGVDNLVERFFSQIRGVATRSLVFQMLYIYLTSQDLVRKCPSIVTRSRCFFLS